MADVMGDRMKGYEIVANYKHTARLPVILRFDGNSFSRFTDVIKLQKPFDPRMERAMQAAMLAVLNYCSGAKLGYVQSDEISILLRNDQTYRTEPFLGARIQKLASLCTAVVAVAFDRAMRDEGFTDIPAPSFDCRVFIVPPADVNNYFLWRQLDCWKNCIGTYAYWKLAEKYGKKTSQKMLYGQGLAERQEIVFKELGVNCNDLPTLWKRGMCLRKKEVVSPLVDVVGEVKFAGLVKAGHAQPGQTITRTLWTPDFEIPRFNEDKGYIEGLLYDELEQAA